MANTFKRYTATLTNSQATVYTVPASTTAIIIGFMISNTTGSTVYVDVEAISVDLGKSLPIPSGSSLSVLDGKLVLEATDTIKVTGDTATSGDIILSLLEMETT